MRHGAVTMFAADKAKLDREMSSPETIYKTMTSSDDGRCGRRRRFALQP
jgi:hypothetical protein